MLRTADVSAEWLDLLQWPAMLVTVAAAWLVASQSARRRKIGFWAFLLSNALWIAWGWSAGAAAIIVLQIALAALNIRGAYKNAARQRDARGPGPPRPRRSLAQRLRHPRWRVAHPAAIPRES